MAGELDALRETDPAVLGTAETVVALHRQLARLEAVATRAMAAFDAAKGWQADGAATASCWLAATCHLPPAAARRRGGAGRALRHMPEVEGAWRAGEGAEAQVALLASAHRLDAEAFGRDEEMLVGHARRLRYRSFSRAMAYWCQLADPDAADADAESLHRARRVHLSQGFKDQWFLNGRLD